MHANLYTVLLLASSPLAVDSLNGISTRYWDCAKPSCGWPGKASFSKPVTACDKNDRPLSDPLAKSGADPGGYAFTCSNNMPWVVNDNLSYGFAATKLDNQDESGWCCACYKLTFTDGPVKGKTMIVQSTNTGGDLNESKNHFDLLMPGGGVGSRNACPTEFGTPFPGDMYGGVNSRQECDQLPGLLRPGCYWRFDWFKGAGNPSFVFVRVRCPVELTSKTGCTRTDDGNYQPA